jgi:hypothetical protein
MSALDELRTLAEKPTAPWLHDLDHHCKGVADAMTAIHGGRWRVIVNHRTCFVVVSKIAD